VRDLVETALGMVLVVCLGLAALLLPCALIDLAAGTNFLGPMTGALLVGLLGAAILGVLAIQQRRSEKWRHRPSEKTAADRDDKSDWRRFS
jgi:hypothetical protein